MKAPSPILLLLLSEPPFEVGECKEQGDQIGRIFAYWAIAFIGQLFSKLLYKS
jgi:hypothetical protein